MTDSYIYTTGLENTATGEDFPIFKTPGDIYVTKKNTDGSINNWQLAGYLPKEVPLNNGGFSIVSNDVSILVIVRADSLTMPVFQANILENGKLSDWENIGELPIDQSQALSTDTQFQYKDSQFIYLNKKSIKTYTVDTVLTLQNEMTLELPTGFDTPYDKPTYFFYHKNELYLMVEVKKSGDTTLQLWHAIKDEKGISFELIETQTGIGKGEFYYFTHNAETIFTLIQTGQSHLSNLEHKISVIQLP